MTSNILKFCTAALAGSILGIAYERLPPSSEWTNVLQSVSAASSLVPKKPPIDDDIGPYKTAEVNPKVSAENFRQSTRFGLPSKDNLRIFNDYILSYDRRLRSPIWVFEHLTPEKLAHNEEVNRNKSKFREDQLLHEYFRAKHADFLNSGYDRGHMAAAANHKVTQDDMDQTFLYSNISPQVPELNRGGWNQLETYVRWRAKRAKNMYVVSGPLYLPLKARDGHLYVTYRVLGNNHISVPTHYFKVFLVEDTNGKLSIEAFLMPNDKSLDDNIRIDEFRVPLERLDIIERSSGVIFFDQLPRNKIDGPNTLAAGFKDGPRQERRRLSDK